MDSQPGRGSSKTFKLPSDNLLKIFRRPLTQTFFSLKEGPSREVQHHLILRPVQGSLAPWALFQCLFLEVLWSSWPSFWLFLGPPPAEMPATLAKTAYASADHILTTWRACARHELHCSVNEFSAPRLSRLVSRQRR